MESRGKRMVLQVLNDVQNDSRKILNTSIEKDSSLIILNENNVSVSDIILLDENMQPLITQSFIEENSMDISSTELCQILHAEEASPKNNIGFAVQNPIADVQDKIGKDNIIIENGNPSQENESAGRPSNEIKEDYMIEDKSPYQENNKSDEINMPKKISEENLMELDTVFTKKGELRKRKKYLLSKKQRTSFFVSKENKKSRGKPNCNCQKKNGENNLGKNGALKLIRNIGAKHFWSKSNSLVILLRRPTLKSDA
uniref:Uncharacterized protein LOC114337067 n=1 Tax=Diabrotica virgifera virgifera TaxID=50390 RepID=A0A6P7G2S5_DIAVI